MMLLFNSLYAHGSGGGGGPHYPGALIALDFGLGIYEVGEVARTLADVIDKPTFVTGGSLQLRFANETTQGSGVVNLIGDALAAVVPDPIGTFLVDWEELITSFESIPFSIQDGAGDPDFNYQNNLQFQRSGGGGGTGDYVFENHKPGPILRDVNLIALSGSGRRQVAATRVLAKLIASADGQAAVDSGDGSIAYTMAADTASFGSFSGDWLYNEINVLRLLLYPERPDADLPILSAL